MLKNYIKIAFKVLLRRKFFTFISLFGISFTLTVLMVVTAFFDHTFGPMAPETQFRRTLAVQFACMYGEDGMWTSSAGYKLLDRYARGLTGVERLSIFSSAETVTSFVNGQKVSSSLKRTDGEFWNVLQFTFLEGGPYSIQDVDQAQFVAVINDTTRHRFFGDAPAVGKTIEADGQRFRVVGVVSDISVVRTIPFAEIWAPLTTAKTDTYKRELMGSFNALALARDEASLDHIHDEFNARLAHVELDNPKVYKTMVAPFETTFDSYARHLPNADRKNPDRQGWRLLATLIGLGLLFMLLPAINLMNLNVSRILERSSEIGVRKAFGASSRTLVGQFVVENVLLTLIGGLIGLILSELVLRARDGEQFDPIRTVQSEPAGLSLRPDYGAGVRRPLGCLPCLADVPANPVEALKGATR